MQTENIYLKILGKSIGVFVISTIISTSIVVGAYYFQRQMLQEYNRANAAFQSISSRYLAVDEEEKLIRSYLPDFVKLYQNGIIGEEQRLNWIEVLRDAGDNISLPSLNYQIESQQVYTPASPLKLGRYKLYSSKMLLNMQLLHEGDLFRILETLDKEAKGSYTVTSCVLGQATPEISDNPGAGNISARCDILWLTIKLADGKPIKV